MDSNKIFLPFVIVVEGKTDSIKLKKLFIVETIETNGSALDKKTIQVIDNLIKRNQNIVFLLDPDVMGNKIRAKLNNLFPNVVNVFLQYQDMLKNKTKIGVAEAKDEILINLLSHIKFDNHDVSDLAWDDMINLNILFNQEIKDKVINYYHLPKVNNKTLFKYLVMLKVKKEDLKYAINN